MPTGAELATAWVRIVPSVEGIQGATTTALGPVEGEAEDAGKRSGSKFSKALKVGLLAGATLAVGGLVSVFNTGLEELKFGEKVSAQTDQLIKNSGAAFSTGMVEKYTLALSGISGVAEEDLQSAGNTLLKFGITNEETYKKAVASINDMAASGKDAGAVAQALGKSLQDPTLAVGALRKQGVTFTAQQEAQIKAMTEAGDVAGAQAIILGQVESVYGGMAETAGGTLEGNLSKLNNTFENMAGTAVETLMPAITGLVEGLQGMFTWISENMWVLPIIATAIGVILVAAFIAWTASIWASTIALLANPITWVVIAIIALIAVIVLLVLNWDAVVKFITDIWAAWIAWIVSVIHGFFGWWNGVWSGFVSWITNIWNLLVRGIQIVWQGFHNWIMSMVNGFFGWWNNIWGTVGDVITRVFSGIGSFVAGVWNGIVSGIRSAVNSIIRVINGAIAGVNGIIGTAGAAFGISLKIPSIPMLADGGTLTRSGLTIVGERGPELLNLPRGAQVNPNYDDVASQKHVNFYNYAPLGQTPAQALSEFANRAEVLL